MRFQPKRFYPYRRFCLPLRPPSWLILRPNTLAAGTNRECRYRSASAASMAVRAQGTALRKNDVGSGLYLSLDLLGLIRIRRVSGESKLGLPKSQPKLYRVSAPAPKSNPTAIPVLLRSSKVPLLGFLGAVQKMRPFFLLPRCDWLTNWVSKTDILQGRVRFRETPYFWRFPCPESSPVRYAILSRAYISHSTISTVDSTML